MDRTLGIMDCVNAYSCFYRISYSISRPYHNFTTWITAIDRKSTRLNSSHVSSSWPCPPPLHDAPPILSFTISCFWSLKGKQNFLLENQRLMKLQHQNGPNVGDYGLC